LADVRTALEIYIDGYGANSASTADTRLTLATILFELGQYRDALEPARRGTLDLEADSGPDDGRVAQGRVMLGRIALRLGRREEAKAALEHGIASWVKLGEAVPPTELAIARIALAEAVAREDRPRARKLVSDAIAVLTGAGKEHAKTLADARALERRLR
jgi:hypothetical protein